MGAKASVSKAQEVANNFVQQYYAIHEQSPEHVHRFYEDDSKLGRPNLHDRMCSITTAEAINQNILFIGGRFSVDIKKVDCHESHKDGLLVMVEGYLTAFMKRRFSQTFILVPRGNDYYILNDVLQYMDFDQQHDHHSVAVYSSLALQTDHNCSLGREQHVQDENLTVEEDYIIVSIEEEETRPTNIMEAAYLNLSISEKETPTISLDDERSTKVSDEGTKKPNPISNRLVMPVKEANEVIDNTSPFVFCASAPTIGTSPNQNKTMSSAPKNRKFGPRRLNSRESFERGRGLQSSTGQPYA